MPRFGWAILIIFALGLLVRLYRFDGPIADWHSFRQSDTNAVSSIYIREGINLIYPKYYDISNLQSTFDNPNGYRFVEFPIYNAIQALLYKTIGFFTLVEWGRVITITASLGSAYLVYLLTRKYQNETAGLFAASIYLFLPYSIFYGRSILPDPLMTTAYLSGIYFFDKWVENYKKEKSKSKKRTSLISENYTLIFSSLCVAVALLLKPFAAFFLLPIVYLAYIKFGFSLIRSWKLWIFGILSILPLIFWRVWVSNFPEGIPLSNWLFNGNNIRFKPVFFKWILYERVTKMILGFFGVVFLFSGLINLKKNVNSGFFVSFIIAAGVYVLTVATGNVQHDYYQIPIIPVIAMVAGVGAGVIFERFRNIFSRALLLGLLFLTFFTAWHGIRGMALGGGVKDFFNVNDRGMVEAGLKADEVLPIDAVVIASHDGSTTLLNLVQRRGWPNFQASLEELKKRGATHMVIANPSVSDLEGFGADNEIMASSSSYLILKLK